jgi:threonine aldolase
LVVVFDDENVQAVESWLVAVAQGDEHSVVLAQPVVVALAQADVRGVDAEHAEQVAALVHDDLEHLVGSPHFFTPIA